MNITKAEFEKLTKDTSDAIHSNHPQKWLRSAFEEVDAMDEVEGGVDDFTRDGCANLLSSIAVIRSLVPPDLRELAFDHAIVYAIRFGAVVAKKQKEMGGAQ